MLAELDLMQRMAANPWQFWFGILVWIPIGAWVIAMVQWMVIGDIDPMFGCGSIFVAFVLGALTVHPPDPRLSPVFFSGVVITVITFPAIQRSLQRREMARIDIEKIEDLYENLRFRPDNYSAVFRLSEILWHRGFHGHAVGLATSVLPKMDPELFREEHQAVDRWRHQLGANFFPKPVRCLQCGLMNQPGSHLCERCQAPYLLLSARTAWLGPSIGRRILGAWIVAIVILVGIPATSQMQLPIPVIILLVLAELALGLVVLLGSFHDTARA